MRGHNNKLGKNQATKDVKKYLYGKSGGWVEQSNWRNSEYRV